MAANQSVRFLQAAAGAGGAALRAGGEAAGGGGAAQRDRLGQSGSSAAPGAAAGNRHREEPAEVRGGGAGPAACGPEEGGEGSGVSRPLDASRVSAEVAAADARGGGSVLQHQEAERREAAAAGQRGGGEDQEEEELSVRDVPRGSQLLAGRRRPQDPVGQTGPGRGDGGPEGEAAPLAADRVSDGLRPRQQPGSGGAGRRPQPGPGLPGPEARRPPAPAALRRPRRHGRGHHVSRDAAVRSMADGPARERPLAPEWHRRQPVTMEALCSESDAPATEDGRPQSDVQLSEGHHEPLGL